MCDIHPDALETLSDSGYIHYQLVCCISLRRQQSNFRAAVLTPCSHPARMMPTVSGFTLKPQHMHTHQHANPHHPSAVTRCVLTCLNTHRGCGLDSLPN